MGYLWKAGDFFLHGFESVMVPTDSRDVTVLFTDIGVGYWVYRGGRESFLTGITPTVELHVNTPLNHRGLNSVPRFRDSVNFTGGAHFEFKDRYMLGLAVSTPIAAAHLYT